MLGRSVADRLLAGMPINAFVAEGIAAALRAADLALLNLECAISTRGTRWQAAGKPFFFRAPPRAVELLRWVGVDCVTLANNHALDYGPDAMLDTLQYLAAAGIATVGAGADEENARRPAVLYVRGWRVGVIGITDHPEEFAATNGSPGVAYADLRSGVPGWLMDLVRSTRERCDVLVVSPHWGPNMLPHPLPEVRAAAAELLAAGATLVAGHSAHVFQGVTGPVLFDLGDFLDDYAVDSGLRNDLGLLWRVRATGAGPSAIAALPLRLDYCHTRGAEEPERDWIEQRLREACVALKGPSVSREGSWLELTWNGSRGGSVLPA